MSDKQTEEQYKTITEGSASMLYPATEESTVFYNPVQVQNRDLSILMISLYAERRALRSAVQAQKKRIRSQKDKRLLDTVEGQEMVKNELKEYEKTLDSFELLKNDTPEESGLTILDALAASGLRSMRYWKEVAGVKHITINDMDKAAVDRAHKNIEYNNLQEFRLDDNIDRKYGIAVTLGDATHELYMSRLPQRTANQSSNASPFQQKTRWDVIDLDPYGSAAPFLDGAVQAIESGGLLCITCTDMAALGGAHPETAYGRYASLPIQSAKYLQELAVRILLYTISASAARYGRTIRPVLSVGMAFYVRVFVEIVDSKQGVRDLSLSVGNVYQSTQCPTFCVLPVGQLGGKRGRVFQSIRLLPTPFNCPETGGPFKVGGPFWLGPLHDKSVVQDALDRLQDTTSEAGKKMSTLATRERLIGLLTSVKDEIDEGAPLYYHLPDLAKTLHCSTPPYRIIHAALKNAGYKVSGYHKDPQALKTDAPSSVIWDIMRSYIDQNPSAKSKKPLNPTSTAAKILAVPPSGNIDFTLRNRPAEEETEVKKVARFPMNPERNWGPKAKGTGYRKKAGDDNGNDASNNNKRKNDDVKSDDDTKRAKADGDKSKS